MTQQSINKRTDWQQMEKQILALIRRLRKKPEELKVTYQRSPGGILSAYTCGDINFEKAMKEFEDWKKRTTEPVSVVCESQRDMRLGLGF